MEYKKIAVLTLAFMLSIEITDAQNLETKYFKNFFGLKSAENLYLQTQFEQIMVDNQIIAFRKYHDNTHTFEQEYIHLKNDTFLFRQYSNLDHTLMTNGKLVATICCSSIDTIHTLDPETYEDILKLYKYWDWSREGHWWVENEDVFEAGHYENNKKIGEWSVFDKKTNYAKYVHYDKGGSAVFEEPRNLLHTNDKKKVAQGLVGMWNVLNIHEWGFELSKLDSQSVGRHGTLIFERDSCRFLDRPRCGGGIENRKKRKWTINDDYVLEIEPFYLKPEKYKIDYLDRTELKLKFLK